MAEEKTDLKSLEMRLAAIEDKLAKLSVTEDEMKAYEKVSSLMGEGGGSAASPCGGCINECGGRARFVCACACVPRARQRIRLICNECEPCWPGGGGFMGGGGFGGFGF